MLCNQSRFRLQTLYKPLVYSKFLQFCTSVCQIKLKSLSKSGNMSTKDLSAEVSKIEDGDGKVQDFYQIRRELCSKGKLFEDPRFPAVHASLFPKGIPKERFMLNYLKWVRPKEITAEPKFFVDGVSRFDIEQQRFGNCWLIAAISRLAMDPNLLFQVVPQDQNFNENYAGIFHFRFWRYGKWVEVVVDDRLPCYGTARSSERTEFWSALLVKAYAKFYGSWEATEDGQSTEAWQDFTGGLTSIYDLDVAQSIPFEVLLEAWEKKLLMGCGTPKMKKLDGLYGDHAYCITEVRKYKGKNMVRLRNPWGMMEWQGQFGDADPLWKTDSKMAEALNFKPDADGEFWMPYELVSDYFTELEICEPLDTSTRKLEVTTFEGEWQYNTTVSKGHLRTLCQNAQYRITLGNSEQVNGKCTMIVALLQKNRRSKRLKNLKIGFEIYQLDNPEKSPNPLDIDFLKKNESVSGSGAVGEQREVQRKFELVPGVYCVIPCVYRDSHSNKGSEFVAISDEAEEFLLRVFFGNSNNLM